MESMPLDGKTRLPVLIILVIAVLGAACWMMVAAEVPPEQPNSTPIPKPNVRANTVLCPVCRAPLKLNMVRWTMAIEVLPAGETEHENDQKLREKAATALSRKVNPSFNRLLEPTDPEQRRKLTEAALRRGIKDM